METVARSPSLFAGTVEAFTVKEDERPAFLRYATTALARLRASDRAGPFGPDFGANPVTSVLVETSFGSDATRSRRAVRAVASSFLFPAVNATTERAGLVGDEKA